MQPTLNSDPPYNVRRLLSTLRRRWERHTPELPLNLSEQLQPGVTIVDFCIHFLKNQRARRVGVTPHVSVRSVMGGARGEEAETLDGETQSEATPGEESLDREMSVQETATTTRDHTAGARGRADSMKTEARSTRRLGSSTETPLTGPRQHETKKVVPPPEHRVCTRTMHAARAQFAVA